MKAKRVLKVAIISAFLLTVLFLVFFQVFKTNDPKSQWDPIIVQIESKIDDGVVFLKREISSTTEDHAGFNYDPTMIWSNLALTGDNSIIHYND